FSSRRRHTRFSRDWSSDVCSSDLGATPVEAPQNPAPPAQQENPWAASVPPQQQAPAQQDPWGGYGQQAQAPAQQAQPQQAGNFRSEERRVGKECKYAWAEADRRAH